MRIVQEIETLPDYQVIYAQTRISPREWDTWNSLGFWDPDRSLKPG